jgi:hypothetical protein
MRKQKTPKADDTFLQRICLALGECPSVVAHNIEVPWQDFKVYLDPHYQLADIERDDEVWWKVSEYVSYKLGLLLAARKELDKEMQKVRARRAVRLNRFRGFHDRSTDR